MKKLIINLFLFLLISLNATIINVNIDGTMDYTVVQDAVNAATNGDTVLVHPGVYNGYTIIEEKYITLASLYLLDPQDEYIGTTILKGDLEHSVIFVKDCEADSVRINGFTITGGGGTILYPDSEFLHDKHYGGGILSRYSNVIIENNIIKRNSVYGNYGGVYVNYSNIFMGGNSIHNNYSSIRGGLCIGLDSSFVFDDENLNSIYNNNGVRGSDIGVVSHLEQQTILLDSVSVLPIESYQVFCNDDDYIIDIQANYAAYEEIDSDLYVSVDGDDNNDGLTPETPFKTISKATRMIKSNPENPNTIYIAEGLYTNEHDNRNFPIAYKEAMNIVGLGDVKLFSDKYSYVFYHGSQFDKHKLTIDNLELEVPHPEIIPMSLTTGLPDETADDNYIKLRNIKVTNSTYSLWLSQNNFEVENVLIEDSDTRLYISHTIPSDYDYCYESSINNFISRNNTRCSLEIASYDTNSRTKVSNMLVHNNRYMAYGADANHRPGYNVYLNSASYVTIANSTIVNNGSYSNVGAGAVGTSGLGTNLELINCLFAENSPRDINVKDSGYGVDTANINYCLFENANTIYTGETNAVNIGVNNIYGEPEFVNPESEEPLYSLSNLSPAVNAGTHEYPDDMEIPEFDLAGNPRIYDGRIDIGAYEWQGTVDNEEDEVSSAPEQVRIYPHPINLNSSSRTNTVIELDIKQAGKVQVGIYNLRGQKIKTLLDAETLPSKFELRWDGRGDNGKLIASGQYFCRIKQYGQTIAKKMMIIK